MKTKKLILGIAAFLFAVGSAFASFVVSSTAQIADIEAVPQGQMSVQCFSSGVTCDETEGPGCRIEVELADESTTTVPGYRQGTNCSVQLSDSNPVPNAGNPVAIEALPQ